MFDFLPEEINLRIYSFFDKRALASVAQVSKLGKKMSENDELFLQLLNLDQKYLPKQFSMKEFYQIYNDLFKLSGSNFCNLLKNNGLSFSELQQSLQCIIEDGISVGYIYSDKNMSPPMLLCPLSFSFNKQPVSLACGFLKSGRELPLPPDLEDLKEKFSFLKFSKDVDFRTDKNFPSKQNINCFVVFSCDKNLADFEETYNEIKKAYTLNKRPMPFIIPLFTPSSQICKAHTSNPEIRKLIQNVQDLPEDKIKSLEKIGGLDKLIDMLSTDHHIKEADEFTPQIHTLSLPIAATVCDLTDRDSSLWQKLEEVIKTIEGSALQLKAIEMLAQKRITYKV